MNIADRVNIANQLFIKGEVDTAIKEYRYLLSLKPDDQVIKENLALALTSKGRLDDAEEVNPDNPYWHGNLGKVLLMQGKIEQAVESYKKCLTM